MSFPLFVVRRVWPLAFCALAIGPGTARGEEAYERFLEGLKEQGLFDVALDYMESMRNSSLVSEAQKQEMPFEQGRLLVENARAENDPTAKTKLLDQARDRFSAFINANPSNPKSASAETELGNVLVERGRSLMEQSNRPANANKKEALLKQARDLLEQAKKVFDEAETKFTERLKDFPNLLDPKKEAKKIEQRDQARADVLKAHLYAAGVLQELAKTYNAESADHKKMLQAAADKYKSLYDKHRRRLAGLMARLKEGQCYQDLGDTKRAIGNYETLLAQGDDPGLRPLKTTALHLTLQCLTSDNEKNYEAAVSRGEDWLERALPADTRTLDGLGITYFTALANKRLADTLTKSEDAQRKKTLLLAAKKQAQFVARASSFNNPYRNEAQQLYRTLMGTESSDQKEPANFTEALDRAKELLEKWQDRLNAVRVAAELKDEANVPKYQSEAAELRDQSLHYFHLALELRDDETPLDSVNIVRYYLCFLDYQAGNYYDAGVLGEFVARNYPKSQGGRQSARIAMASYLQTFETARRAQMNNDFDRDKMIEIADFITSAWPGGEEADDAWSILLQLAVGEGQLDKALAYLAKIPEDSPRRGDADLKAGQALWAAYLAAARRGEADRPPQAELDKMFQSARGLLDDGLKRTRVDVDAGSKPVSLTMAAAALSLGQMYVESGEAGKSIELLNDAKIGPLALVVADDPVTKQGKFAIEADKLALRAYVANQSMDKAEAVMESLEKLVNASGDADAGQLTRIYVALGRELEQQLQRLRQEEKTEEVSKVSKGFELFLDRISSREKGNTFNSLNWVAETFFSLGSGHDGGGAREAGPEAKAYYDKSLATDQKILEAVKNDKSFGPEGGVLAVKLRMARTERRLRSFDKARDLIVEVLKEKANLLDAQVEAARTFQDWGAEKPEYYMKAIAGDIKQKTKEGREENLIWGWAKIAIRAQPQKAYDAAFYEARYSQARCYMELAQKKAGGQKKELLQKAERDVLFTYRIRPQLGGPEWTKKFDLLLRSVQQLLGNSKPTGLPAESAKPTALPTGRPDGLGPAKLTPAQAASTGAK